MRVLVAPDKFKDALDAPAVARAMADGVHDAHPAAHVDCCPLADGGDGSGPILAATLGASVLRNRVLDPLGRPRGARWWHASAAGTAIVEMAEASGLRLLPRGQRCADRATSFGTGQLIRAAVDAGCQRVLICAGGSASVDGGAGCLQAMGWTMLDADGTPVVAPACGRTLRRIARLEPPARRPPVALEVLCDVDSPLTGPRGAAPLFAPQKGATPAQVADLAGALEHWAHLLERATGIDVRAIPGGGAAGGLPAALHAACGAAILPGFDQIARRVGLSDRLRECDLCLTGEGCIDEQTARGKVVSGVAAMAREAGVPVIAFAGAVRPPEGRTAADLAADLALRSLIPVTPPGMALDRALREAAQLIRAAVARAL